MDPFTTQALADLKDLLREKVITLAEWREEVAALHERARPAPAPVAAADDDYDETMALIEREKARNVRKPRAAKAPEVKAEEDEKGGDLKYVNGEVAYQWSAWDWEIGAGRFHKISPQAFFKEIREQTIQRLNDDLAEHRGLKYNLNLDVRYFKEEKEGRVTQTIGHITKTAILLSAGDTAEQVDAAFADLATKTEEFEAHGGSGWIFDTCERLVISGNPWRPIRGRGFVKTPPAQGYRKCEKQRRHVFPLGCAGRP